MVLDTDVLPWWGVDPDRLSAAASDALSQLSPAAPGLVSSISFWELALKARRRGRQGDPGLLS